MVTVKTKLITVCQDYPVAMRTSPALAVETIFQLPPLDVFIKRKGPGKHELDTSQSETSVPNLILIQRPMIFSTKTNEV